MVDLTNTDEPWMKRYLGVIDFLSIIKWMTKDMGSATPASLDALLSLKADIKSTPVSVLECLAREYLHLTIFADRLL